MPRPVRPLAVLFLLALLAPTATIQARGQKTVFHGMPVEPDTGFLKPRDVTSISLDPVWVYEGFAAPLAGEAAEAGMRVVASDRSGRVVSIDIAGGSAVWTVELGEALPVGPAVASGLILQGTTSGLLVALGTEDGRERWRATLGAAPAALPILERSRLLVVTLAPELVSLDPADGRVLSRLPLPGAPFAPAIGPEGVVIGTAPGQVIAAGGEPLAIQWTRDLGHQVTGPALVDRRHVLVATDDRALWSLRGGSGRTSWKQRVGSRVTARPRVVGDLLYVACWDNDFYVLGRKNGHILGRSRLGHRLSGETTLLGQLLFVAPATEASVVALELPYLGVAGRSELGAPGEWFTTAPVAAAALPGVTVGWGRTTGRLLALKIGEPPAPPAAPVAGSTPPH
ncbi:MAG TPA: PQQ-binding-like beta-propeller repeat protein [Dongiaceae bacterium]|nr:PQQ-binding-like beta-propeller repeat protein [Dongiaceae bacterium]